MASTSSQDCYYISLGLGIGVPLAVLFLAALITAIYYRHKYLETKKFLQHYQQNDNSRPVETTEVGPQKSISDDSGMSASIHRSMSQHTLASQHQRPAHQLHSRPSQVWPLTPGTAQTPEPRVPHPILLHQNPRSPIIPVSELANRRSNSQHRNWSKRDNVVGMPPASELPRPSAQQEPHELGDGRKTPATAGAASEQGRPIVRARRSSEVLVYAGNDMRDSYTTW